MPIRLLSLIPLVAAGAALAACGRGAPVPEPQVQLDPAIAAALSDPIMIDPDLVSQNHGNAAIVLDTFDAVPLYDTSPEAIEAARGEAARLAGGVIRTAPDPVATASAFAPAVTAGQLAAELPTVPARCIEALRYGYAWAATLPQTLPVYPRGHVQEAAGSVAAGCQVRAIRFVTPVDPSAVVDFYFTRAQAGGYGVKRSRMGDADVLNGAKDGGAFLVRTRRGDDGLTEVELATQG